MSKKKKSLIVQMFHVKLKIMKYTKFENIAYSYEPSPLDADSRAVAFIRLHPNWLRIDVNENYYRVRFSELISTDGKSSVFIANCRLGSNRYGRVFSHASPTALLQDVCDYVGVI